MISKFEIPGLFVGDEQASRRIIGQLKKYGIAKCWIFEISMSDVDFEIKDPNIKYWTRQQLMGLHSAKDPIGSLEEMQICPYHGQRLISSV